MIRIRPHSNARWQEVDRRAAMRLCTLVNVETVLYDSQMSAAPPYERGNKRPEGCTDARVEGEAEYRSPEQQVLASPCNTDSN